MQNNFIQHLSQSLIIPCCSKTTVPNCSNNNLCVSSQSVDSSGMQVSLFEAGDVITTISMHGKMGEYWLTPTFLCGTTRLLECVFWPMAAVCLVYLQLIHRRSDLLHLLDSKLDHLLHLLLRCLQLGLREPNTRTHASKLYSTFPSKCYTTDQTPHFCCWIMYKTITSIIACFFFFFN